MKKYIIFNSIAFLLYAIAILIQAFKPFNPVSIFVIIPATYIIIATALYADENSKK